MKRIAITVGDINGIGPEIVGKALIGEKWSKSLRFTLFGPEKTLQKYYQGFPIDLSIINCGKRNLRPKLGQVTPEAGEVSFLALKEAVTRTLKGEFHALVTAPISKKALNLAGHHYSGHTEMLREWCGVEEVLMMFLTDKIKVGLVTAHVPLTEVPKVLNEKLVINKIKILNYELQSRFDIDKPHIALCALNPHAGEEGLFGREEIEILLPAVEKARSEGIDITNPLPSDTLFKRAGEYSAVMALYHDQGLIPVKIQPGSAVNFTAGLPIIRTSPAHGTAFDIAKERLADPTGMINAIKWAVKLKCKV